MHIKEIGNGMKRAFKYRLYPNKAQATQLTWILDRTRELYNAALQERRDAYEMTVRRSPHYYDKVWRKEAIKALPTTFYDQARQLPEIKTEIRFEYKDIYAQILVETLQRVERTFAAFFARCKQGKEPGFPRYKGKHHYQSFTYPEVAHGNGPKIQERHILFPKIGTIRVKWSRPLEGKIKTVTIKREGEHWYVVFACEVEQSIPLPLSYEDVGIDLGVTHLATLSTGETIEHPRYLRTSAKTLEKLQQALSRKKRGSNRRKRAAKAVAKVHRKIARQRRDFLHKQSRKIVNSYQVIVFEDLATANLTKHPKPKQDEEGKYLPNKAGAKAGLNKSILDAGWGIFVELCTYKAENAGRTLLQVNPRNTSQRCSGCGAIVKKDLSDRWHSCTCGTELDRDHNAAINILRLGSSLRSDPSKVNAS